MDEMKSISGNSDAQVSWSKRVKKEDGSEIRVDVEKINNGFLKTTTTEGKSSNGEWEYKTEKEFSETNPFEEDEESEEKELSLADKLESFFKK
jgi:hypothetical protein